MTDDAGAWLINFLASYPWIIWVYVGATVVASVLRATWSDEATRPKAVVAILALCDILQLNVSGPVKLLAAKKP